MVEKNRSYLEENTQQGILTHAQDLN